jgi:hypothetical protein
MIARLTGVIVCLAAVLCLAGPTPSPDLVFKDLDGVPRRPLEAADKAGTVLVFYWHDCPISNSYAPELNRLWASHTNFAFYIVQVDPDLSPAAAREHARKFDLHAPVLLDPRHRLVNQVHVTVTPETVVMGKDGQILYRGRIDDGYAALGKKRAAVTQHDLLEALDAIAAGRPVKTPETKAVGCLIQ